MVYAASRTNKKGKQEGIFEIKEARGACKFCGQITDINVLEIWPEDDYNEIATEMCDCSDAKHYTHQKSQKERGHNRIEKLFGEENGELSVTKEARDLLHSAVDATVECKIGKMTVELGGGAKASMNLNNKGILKIKRVIKKESEMEA